MDTKNLKKILAGIGISSLLTAGGITGNALASQSGCGGSDKTERSRSGCGGGSSCGGNASEGGSSCGGSSCGGNASKGGSSCGGSS